MKKIESVLFQGITENEWMHMLDLGCMRTQHFAKNTIILHTGEHIHEIGIVLSGSVNIENIDLWGNKKYFKQYFSRTGIRRILRALSRTDDG